jgi:hypothetical protein
LRFQNPLFAVMPPRDPHRWFIGEREGRVLVVPDRRDASQAVTVLDLRKQTLGWQDCGLLNMPVPTRPAAKCWAVRTCRQTTAVGPQVGLASAARRGACHDDFLAPSARQPRYLLV